MTKALALLSGGLDSSLAVWLIKKQKIKITGLIFTSPFFGPGKAIASAKQLKIPYEIIDIGQDLINIIKNPEHGFGDAMNPCIDCHTLMLKKARKILEKENYNFVITGEVLGQRPFSQNRHSLKIISQESGLKNKLLRPLSAKLLEITEPERIKLVNREKLLAIQGRQRKTQIALAKKAGIKYVQPAGGCLLTESGFCQKLNKLQQHQPKFKPLDAELLKIGRHFWLNKTQIILGRDFKENQILEKLASSKDRLIKPANFIGPTALIRKSRKNDKIRLIGGHKAKKLILKHTPETKQKLITKPIIFFGSSKNSVLVLKKLLKNNFPVALVITQPDRPAGRGKKLQKTPIAKFCKTKKIKILKFAKLNDKTLKKTQNALKTKPILAVTAVYGNLIPGKWLDWLGLNINLHPSLLPKWRGAAPTIRAIQAGNKTTGITLFKIVKKMDAGQIISQIKSKIKSRETAGELTTRLFELGTNKLIELLNKKLITQKPTFWILKPQDHSKKTIADKIKKTEAEIDWGNKPEQIKNKIHAFNPWPGAYTFVKIKNRKTRLKIWRAEVINNKLIPKIVQLAGKNKSSWEQFSRDYNITIDKIIIKSAKKK